MKTKLKRRFQEFSARHGYHVIPEWQAREWPLSRHLRQLFKTLNIQCVLDVGANEGQYHDFLRDAVGFTGLIVSFEPIAGLAGKLSARAKSDANWRIVNCALGDAPGTAEFNVMADTQFSSFLAPDHKSVGRFKQENAVVRKEVVRVETLDGALQMMQQEIGARNLYLKLDTQGFDLNVMRGGLATLGKVLGMQTEASVRPIYDGMPNHKEALEAVESRGFDLSGMFPISKDRTQRLIEYDMVFVNRQWADANI